MTATTKTVFNKAKKPVIGSSIKRPTNSSRFFVSDNRADVFTVQDHTGGLGFLTYFNEKTIVFYYGDN